MSGARDENGVPFRTLAARAEFRGNPSRDGFRDESWSRQWDRPSPETVRAPAAERCAGFSLTV
jgi:hypothetical protein